MIARCPGCQTRYRVAPEKIGPKGARIRCSRCQHVFRVEPPAEAAAPRRPAFKVRALVAEPDPELAKAVVSYLERWQIGSDVVPDGGEALLRLHRQRPRLAILGGHLPGVRATAVAEILRRNADLQDLPLIRVAPTGEPGGAPEFDADHVLEPGDVPEGLGAILQALGVGERPAAPRPPAPRPVPSAPAARSQPAAGPSAPPAAPPPTARPSAPASARRAVASSDAPPELAAAERLARISISDIVLYNEEKFARGAASGNVVAELEAELQEARAMFNQRVSEKLRAQRDFLVEELERRAERARPSS